MHKWSDISSHYGDCLLLGNGASIAIEPQFRYPPLYEAAISHNHLGAFEQAIFDFFGTCDFEFILRALSQANAINRHLGVDESATAQAYEKIKEALIKTVKDVHPEYADVKSQLLAVAGFLSKFKTVFSLNYDLLIYWALMAANNSGGGHLIKDCFLHGRFKSDYDLLRAPHGKLSSSTLLFYLHGNLALATDLFGTVTKIQRSQEGLMSKITEGWTLGGCNPLFVSEGDSSRKQLAIGRSYYLQAAYTELSANRKSILIYGWSCGTEDSHILAAVARAGIRLIGISVYTGKDSTPENFCCVVELAIRETPGLERTAIEFFDSSDSGVWIHPPS